MGFTNLKKRAVIYNNKVLNLKDDLVISFIAKSWMLGSELNIGEVSGIYWINCLQTTKNKSGQNFYLKYLANGKLKAQSNCYIKHIEGHLYYVTHTDIYIIYIYI